MGSIPTVSFASSRSTPTRTNPNVVRGNRSFQPLPRGRTSTITGREFGDSIAAYDSTRMAVTTAGNQTISIKPMVTALQKVAPAAAQRPFETGDDGSLHFSQETRRAVSSNRGQLRNVGGVALDVMFESLAAAGVAEARINGPQALIENPVLISLKRLVAAAEPYAVSPERWAQLPDNIRYPGDIGRVRGAVLDPVKQDVFIVGTPAASRETRLDIDVLSVLTDVAWKQGITPGVSLDPTMVPSASSASNVADLSLAMIPRLINLPEGSLVARILLDADYEMKFINTGQIRIDDPDFNNFFDLLKRDPPSGRQTNRFWFHPVPMTPGSVRLSGDGNVVLFDAAVQVLTEDLDTTAMGTGTANQTSLEAAEKFTRAFDRIETSPDVKPAGIFTLLKAANDVVTFGAILREAGISYPALEELRQLPFRHLAMPASYPSVSAEFIQRIDSSHEKQWKLSGGVTLQSRVHRRSYDQFEDGASAALRKGAAAMKDGEFSATLRTSFMLTRPDPGGSAKATLAKLAGRQLLLTNKPADAATKYAEAAAGDPLDVEAWVWLAISDLAAKRFADASAAIEKAKLVDPDDALVRGTAVTVALLSGAQLHLDTLDPTLRTGISQQLSEAAGSRLVGGETDAAAEAAGLSVKLWNGNGWAHCVLGVVFSQKGQFPDAVRELGEAPCLRSAPVFILNMRAFDFAKLGDPGRAIADYDEAIRLDPKYAASFDGRGDAYLDRKDTEKALSDFGRAIELDPKRALFRESRGRALLAKGDTAGAMADFEQAVKLDPGSAPTHFVRASAFLLQKDYAHAMSDIDETIRIDPATPRAYIIRGLAHEGTGNTELALQDYADSIRTQPGQLFAYERRAIIYANKQDFARSIAEYTELLKRDPLYKDAAFNRAMATGKSGDNAGAIVRFGEAIAADPKSAPAHLWRGIGYLTGGQPDAAIADFSRAIGLDGNNGDAYLRRGRAYEMKGDRANAAADYEAAQRLGRTP
jgi:tetratricopeptide (TPR) repeat protein